MSSVTEIGAKKPEESKAGDPVSTLLTRAANTRNGLAAVLAGVAVWFAAGIHHAQEEAQRDRAELRAEIKAATDLALRVEELEWDMLEFHAIAQAQAEHTNIVLEMMFRQVIPGEDPPEPRSTDEIVQELDRARRRRKRSRQ